MSENLKKWWKNSYEKFDIKLDKDIPEIKIVVKLASNEVLYLSLALLGLIRIAEIPLISDANKVAEVMTDLVMSLCAASFVRVWDSSLERHPNYDPEIMGIHKPKKINIVVGAIAGLSIYYFVYAVIDTIVAIDPAKDRFWGMTLFFAKSFFGMICLAFAMVYIKPVRASLHGMAYFIILIILIIVPFSGVYLLIGKFFSIPELVQRLLAPLRF